MYQDFLNMFDYAAVITVTRNSTNAIDLLRAAQDLGQGEPLKVMVTVVTAFTAGGAATLNIALVTSADPGLGPQTVLQDQPTVIPVASLVAGFEIRLQIIRRRRGCSIWGYFIRWRPGPCLPVRLPPKSSGKLRAGRRSRRTMSLRKREAA